MRAAVITSLNIDSFDNHFRCSSGCGDCRALTMSTELTAKADLLANNLIRLFCT